jgi:hypothetical protein
MSALGIVVAVSETGVSIYNRNVQQPCTQPITCFTVSLHDFTICYRSQFSTMTKLMRSASLRRPLLTIPHRRLGPGAKAEDAANAYRRWSATFTGDTKYQPPEGNQAAGG